MTRMTSSNPLGQAIQKFLKAPAIFQYLVGGGIAVVVHMSILIGLVELFGVYAVVASTLGLIAGVVVKYLFQYYVTFRESSRGHRSAAWRFIAVTSFTLFLNYLMFTALEARMHYVIAQAITICAIFLVNFGINKAFTFQDVDQ